MLWRIMMKGPMSEKSTKPSWLVLFCWCCRSKEIQAFHDRRLTSSLVNYRTNQGGSQLDSPKNTRKHEHWRCQICVWENIRQYTSNDSRWSLRDLHAILMQVRDVKIAERSTTIIRSRVPPTSKKRTLLSWEIEENWGLTSCKPQKKTRSLTVARPRLFETGFRFLN